MVAFSEAEEIDVLVGYFRVSFFKLWPPWLPRIDYPKEGAYSIDGHQLNLRKRSLILERTSGPLSVPKIWITLCQGFNQSTQLSKSDELKNDVLILIE